MTITEIKERIEEIKECSDDNETAHTLEDALRTDFIKYISLSQEPIGDMAKLILTTSSINFQRWYA